MPDPGDPHAARTCATLRAAAQQPEVDVLDLLRRTLPAVVGGDEVAGAPAELRRTLRLVDQLHDRVREGVDLAIGHDQAGALMGEELGRAGEGDDGPGRRHVVQ